MCSALLMKKQPVITIKIESLYQNYIFLSILIFPIILIFTTSLEKFGTFEEFVENCHNKSDAVSSSCTSFSILFSNDSLWGPGFCLLERCLMVMNVLLQHKLSMTFQLSQCGQPATGIFRWWFLWGFHIHFYFKNSLHFLKAHYRISNHLYINY